MNGTISKMVSEKIAKGFQTKTGGGPYAKTHVVFVKFLQGLKNHHRLYKNQLGFKDKSKESFWACMDGILPFARLVEDLHPSGSDFDDPNPEYPWSDSAGTVYCPTTYGFTEFQARQRELDSIRQLLIRLFDSVGYKLHS